MFCQFLCRSEIPPQGAHQQHGRHLLGIIQEPDSHRVAQLLAGQHLMRCAPVRPEEQQPVLLRSHRLTQDVGVVGVEDRKLTSKCWVLVVPQLDKFLGLWMELTSYPLVMTNVAIENGHL